MCRKIKDKKILIMGLGRSGIAAMEAALEEGASVYVQDTKSENEIDEKTLSLIRDNKVRAWFGTEPDDLSIFDMLILSPGVPVSLPVVEKAKEAGAEIIGELEFAYRLGRGHYIAITGTNGKTTTTTLVGEIIKASGRDTSVVGNIGIPVIGASMRSTDDSWLVTEVSSFQLETTDEFRPEVSAILNLTEDHMDRHKTMENYGNTKARVFMRQSPDQFCVINYDDKATLALSEKCPARVVPFSRLEQLEFGAFVKNGKIVIRDGDEEITICSVDELRIPGTHNLENALAAAAIAWFAGVDAEVIGRVMKEFAGVEHRIEDCGTIDGVHFVNDSKGTNPDAAIKAIEAMKENIILIAGGYDKKADYSDFIKSLRGRVKYLLLMGETAEDIKKTAIEHGFTDLEICEDMKMCVERGWQISRPGDTVLLSPACASWDMYKNFELRGEDFKECVKGLRP